MEQAEDQIAQDQTSWYNELLWTSVVNIHHTTQTDGVFPTVLTLVVHTQFDTRCFRCTHFQFDLRKRGLDIPQPVWLPDPTVVLSLISQISALKLWVQCYNNWQK